MRLSEYDRVICLTIDRRFKKEYDRIVKMLGGRGVIFRFFVDGGGTLLHPSVYDQITVGVPVGWKHGRGAYAHFTAMKTVIQKAKDDGVKTLLWIEDDCVLTTEFDDVLEDAVPQLGNLPEWDMLYYGANHTWGETEQVAPNVLRCHGGSYTTHCVGIRHTIFDAILGLPPHHVIDHLIAHNLQHCYNCYAIWPAIATQKRGYSYLSNTEMNYEDYFKIKGANQL